MGKLIFVVIGLALLGSMPSSGIEQQVPQTGEKKEQTLAPDKAEQSTEEQIKAINTEIDQLSQQIQKKRSEALNTQIEAQGLLQTEWEAYTHKIVEADRQTEAAKALELQMHELQAKKKSLVESQYRRQR